VRNVKRELILSSIRELSKAWDMLIEATKINLDSYWNEFVSGNVRINLKKAKIKEDCTSFLRYLSNLNEKNKLQISIYGGAAYLLYIELEGNKWWRKTNDIDYSPVLPRKEAEIYNRIYRDLPEIVEVCENGKTRKPLKESSHGIKYDNSLGALTSLPEGDLLCETQHVEVYIPKPQKLTEMLEEYASYCRTRALLEYGVKAEKSIYRAEELKKIFSDK
jgi:hypothetical protein